MEKVRLQKIIADSGYCSRRKAEQLIDEGVVRVNGRPVKLGDKADPKNDLITVDGEKLRPTAVAHRYIKLYKPRGYVTTMSDEQGRRIVTELLTDVPERVYPVGRLDRNSEGLLLLTNDGAFANDMTHPTRHVPKVYRVTVAQRVTEEQVERLAGGVEIGEGEVTRPCKIEVLTEEEGRTVLEFVIKEGKNRQLRRMCEAVGLTVKRLRRTSVGGVKLGMLRPGEYADLTKEELTILKNAVKGEGRSRK
ncbi:MAG: rRNA pseudouridine synthase [Bacteroides sp.]|nr:rRNA pseudouridine synthase [Eubacterium sp.]MCM1419020.1 rRNA pseudouridine synthase [Roseburia sp.]MCM1462858.1 rRNA pseudouridine synthase [Bacteroides sp.]